LRLGLSITGLAGHLDQVFDQIGFARVTLSVMRER